MKALQIMSEQIFYLIKYQNLNFRLPPHEFDKHFLGL
jgi:hypothetical protein